MIDNNELTNEQLLFSMWLRGENLADMKLFVAKDFNEEKLFELVEAGGNLLTVGRETHRLSELAQWTSILSTELYKQALNAKAREKIYREIYEMKNLDEIRAKIELLDEINGEQVEEVSNPAMQIVKELDSRAKQKLVKWSKLPTLNSMTDGIKKKELTSIAARPSVGKSAFGLQVALGVVEAGEKVLYFPLEMSCVQTYSRAIISKGILSSKEMRTGKIENQANYGVALDYVDKTYKSGNFKVYEGCSQIEFIEALIKKEKPFLVVIDQLSQMKSNKKFHSIREQFSYMTSTLKAIAMKYDVAIFLLCQINRGADDVEPTMANLKESGSIEEDSDNVILLHNLRPDDLANPETIDWQNERVMKLNLAKQRDGEIGKFYMMFRPSRFLFYERSNKC